MDHKERKNAPGREGSSRILAKVLSSNSSSVGEALFSISMARCRNAVAVDGEGNVVAAGFIVNAEIASGGPGGIMFARPFTVIKFNGATGQSSGARLSTTPPPPLFLRLGPLRWR